MGRLGVRVTVATVGEPAVKVLVTVEGETAKDCVGGGGGGGVELPPPPQAARTSRPTTANVCFIVSPGVPRRPLSRKQHGVQVRLASGRRQRLFDSISCYARLIVQSIILEPA